MFSFYRNNKTVFGIFAFLSFSEAQAEVYYDLAGKTQFEGSWYTDKGQFEGQDYRYNLSVAGAPEFYWEWNDGNDSLIFTPFYRIDQRDDQRTHGDIRELAWVHVSDSWEFRTGIRKVFWGVTEFVHLADIINQTDNVESFDNEEKLGQPMFNVSHVADWGIVDAFVLTGFRERTFPGVNGRLRSELIVDTDNPIYESDDEEKHIDYSLRWSHTINVIDMGVYWFDGTDRQPLFQPVLNDGNPRLLPFYQQVTQFGTDIQATLDSWLLKFEAIHKDSNADTFWATQAGFEYTLYGLRASPMDLGLLLEYGWDERGKEAISISQNDIYTGARLTFNDADNTAILMGASYDIDFHTRTLLIEASRRINDNWTVELEALAFKASNPNDIAADLDQDDRILLSFERFF